MARNGLIWLATWHSSNYMFNLILKKKKILNALQILVYQVYKLIILKKIDVTMNVIDKFQTFHN